MSVVIIELGCANTASVLFALQRLGANPILSSDPAIIAKAERLILPGVGAAGFVMARIHELGLYDIIKRFKRPLLGVCLGQQLLFEASDEGDVACLGLIPGRVTKIIGDPDLVVPHMGWNQLSHILSDPLTEGLNTGDYAYFVHSYACPVNEFSLAQSHYGAPFAAMVRKDNIWGAQFHPERSSHMGALILKHFLEVQA